MFEIHKIHLIPALRIAAVMGAVIGLCSVLIFVLSTAIFGGMFFGYYSSYFLRQLQGLALPAAVVFLVSIVFSVVGTLIAIPIYNFIAQEFGGFAIDLRKLDAESDVSAGSA